MVQANEIVMLLLGIGVLFFTSTNSQAIKRLPAWKILISGFYVLLAAWVLTVLEGFLWQGFLNYLEHICYAGSFVLLAFWSFKVFHGKRKAR